MNPVIWCYLTLHWEPWGACPFALAVAEAVQAAPNRQMTLWDYVAGGEVAP